MASKNGSKELVSLLQYMKNTDIDNPEILVKDERIVELDSIVTEVKSSEEWEDVSMNIYERGIEQGIEQGQLLMLYKLVETGKMSLEDAATTLGKMLMCHKETHKRLIDSSLLFRKFCFRTFFFNADML